MVEIANDFDFEWKGIHVMIGGLGLQVGSIIIFLLFFADFTQKARRKQSNWSEKYRQLCRSPGFIAFQLGKCADGRIRKMTNELTFRAAILAATVAILIRSIFRVAELYQGFHGEIWNNEAAFMVLEGGAISFACLSVTIFHPGWNFSGAWHDTKTQPIRGRKTDTEAISLQ